MCKHIPGSKASLAYCEGFPQSIPELTHGVQDFVFNTFWLVFSVALKLQL